MPDVVSGIDLANKQRELRLDPGGRQVPSLIRPVASTNSLSDDLDLTKDPADGSTVLGPASGIYSVGGGDVALLMSGSDTPSTFTLAAGGSRTVSIRKLLKTGTTCTSVEVSW